MLIEFTIENFRSFKERQTFSMFSIKKFKELQENVAHLNHLDLIKSAVIYGKNASGKSNLLMAFYALQSMVLNSTKLKKGDSIPPYEPFKMDTMSFESPVGFEIIFLGKDNIRYKYNIEFGKKEIYKEVLYYYPKGQPALIFSRENNIFKNGEPVKNEIDSIQKRLFENQLLLSKAGMEKIDVLIQPYEFFKNYFYVNITNSKCSACDRMFIDIHAESFYQEEKPYLLKEVNKLLRIADTGIKEIYIKEYKEGDFNFPETINEEKRKKIFEENKYEIFAKHSLYENDNVIGETTLEIEEESDGTIKLFAIGSQILDALSDGSVIVIDELDRSLHPQLSYIIVKLFNNPETNPNNAQLIFATHDISLLNNSLFRRDQIWFTEKDEMDRSTFYSLGDLKGVRKDVPYAKYYMNGLFGGTPNLNFYNFFFQLRNNEKETIK